MIKSRVANQAKQIGDREGGDRFVALASRQLGSGFRLASLLLGNASDAEEAVRRALLEAWSAWPRLGDVDGFTIWFERHVLVACRAQGRRRQRLRSLAAELSRPDADPFATALVADPLGRAFLTLPDVQREALVLRYCGGRSEDQVEEDLHAGPGTVAADLRVGLAGLFAGRSSDGEGHGIAPDEEWHEYELTTWFASLPRAEAPVSLGRFLDRVPGHAPGGLHRHRR
jgi:DNA-directed RNA polymerase specialized sigma24 family protein